LTTEASIIDSIATLEQPPAVGVSFPEPFPVSRWEPKITGVVPVVRSAILVRHDPPLAEKHPALVKDVIDQAWSRWAETYRTAIAEMADVPAADLSLDGQETIRLRYDANTTLIDLPKIRSRSGSARLFDLRSCVALCVDEYSSKIWTRIGPPYPSKRGWDVDHLSPVLDDYRSLAQSSSEWFLDQFSELTKDVLSGHRMSREGLLEVTTIGLRVRGDTRNEDYFDSWLFHKDGPNLDNEELRRFMTEAVNLGYDIRQLKTREPKSFWMSMPMAVQLANGDLATRTALYLVKPVNDMIQVVGICLDDSRLGDFASEVALKVARVVANRI